MDWQEILKTNFRDLKSLAQFLEISSNDIPELFENPSFPINVPRRLALKMKKGDIRDPLFLQFVPLSMEKRGGLDFVEDPVQDKIYTKEAKLIRKYAKRALIVSTSVCAMHCRYCFRQNYPYHKEGGFDREIDWIIKNPDIFEVILSGGDPLSLPDAALERLLDRIDQIEHVKVVRFHTRFIIGIPERVTEKLLSILSNRRAQIIMVFHINHPHELDFQILSAFDKLRSLSIPLMTQTVFLKGVNDDANLLETLFLQLVARGVMPYQIHRLDKVRGASHFAMEEERAKMIMRELDRKIPGYALPEFTADVPGEESKKRLMWS